MDECFRWLIGAKTAELQIFDVQSVRSQQDGDKKAAEKSIVCFVLYLFRWCSQNDDIRSINDTFILLIFAEYLYFMCFPTMTFLTVVKVLLVREEYSFSFHESWEAIPGYHKNIPDFFPHTSFLYLSGSFGCFFSFNKIGCVSASENEQRTGLNKMLRTTGNVTVSVTWCHSTIILILLGKSDNSEQKTKLVIVDLI